MNLIKQVKEQGISLRRTFLVMLLVSILLTIVMLFTAFRTIRTFTRLSDATDTYIELQETADNLMKASDYLTEEAQCYTVLGDREYMENYFAEANVARRREMAKETMEKRLPGSGALRALKSAMKESVSLMDREYYAMMLVMMAQDDSSIPEPLKGVKIKPEDARLKREEKWN